MLQFGNLNITPTNFVGGEPNMCFGKYMFEKQPNQLDWEYAKPEEWGGLCMNGKHQSPIDLPRSGEWFWKANLMQVKK